MQQKQQEIEALQQQQRQEEQKTDEIQCQIEQKKLEIDEHVNQAIQEMNNEKQQKIEEAKQQKDDFAQKQFSSKLDDAVDQTGYIQREKDNLKFNVDYLVERLSEYLLQDVLERQDPNLDSGFKSLLEGGKGLGFSSRGKIKPNIPPKRIDWSQSKINTRLAGRSSLEEDDLTIRYPESESTIYAAIGRDISGSMTYNKLDEPAKLLSLAVSRAITLIDPDNEVHNFLFGNKVTEVTLSQLFTHQTDDPGNTWTNTSGMLYKARDSFSESKKSVGLVYIITDGLPNGWGMTNDGEYVKNLDANKAMAYTLEAARLYNNLPDLYLRIFLLGKQFVDDAIKITEAAGPKTKLIATDISKLEQEVFSDLSDIFAQIHV